MNSATTSPGQRPVGRRFQRGFTLLELLVAMSIFVSVLGILFGTLSQIQKIWTLQRTRMEIYENARLVFDLISRDVQAVVTSQDPGGQIWVAGSVVGQPEIQLALVTQSGIGVHPNSDSPLAEVVYRLVTTGGTDTTLWRHCTTSSNGGSYDFFNQHPNVWATTLATGEIVADRIDTMVIRLFDLYGNPITPASDTVLARVEVDITLSDAASDPSSETIARRMIRTFSKRIMATPSP